MVNVENLCEDPVFQEMFAEIGIDSNDLKENKETQQAIYDFIEKAGSCLNTMVAMVTQPQGTKYSTCICSHSLWYISFFDSFTFRVLKVVLKKFANSSNSKSSNNCKKRRRSVASPSLPSRPLEVLFRPYLNTAAAITTTTTAVVMARHHHRRPVRADHPCTSHRTTPNHRRCRRQFRPVDLADRHREYALSLKAIQ